MTAEELLEETLERLNEATGWTGVKIGKFPVPYRKRDLFLVYEDARETRDWLDAQLWRLKHGVGAAK